MGIVSITGSKSGLFKLDNAKGAWNNQKTIYTITLDETADEVYIQNGETLTVTMGNTVTDIAGNPVSTIGVTSKAVAKETTAPTILATSVLGNKDPGGTEGTIENDDTITLDFSEAMDTSITQFNVTVSKDSSVITIKAADPDDIFVTITATEQKYNNHATETMTFNGSTGVWNAAKTQLVISLANLADGSANPGQPEGTCSIVAGPLVKDLVGNSANTNAVTSASGGF